MTYVGSSITLESSVNRRKTMDGIVHSPRNNGRPLFIPPRENNRPSLDPMRSNYFTAPPIDGIAKMNPRHPEVIKQTVAESAVTPKKKTPHVRHRPPWLRVLQSTAYAVFLGALIFGIPPALSTLLDTPYPMAAITSSSMWPELRRGDLIIIQGVNRNELGIGDIVVYKDIRGTFTIHRIIALNSKTFQTKGDANNVKDEPVTYDRLVGRLLTIGKYQARIPKFGFISLTINSLNGNAQAEGTYFDR